MARVQNPVIGQTSGQAGGMVFANWKGIKTMRAKALTVANPQTDAQMKQRAKISLLLTFFQLMALACKKGFKELAVRKSEYNAFVSENALNGFLTWSGSAWNAVYPNLKIGKGSLNTTSISGVSATNASASVTVTFPSTASGNQSTSDIANVVIISGENYGQNIGTVSRSAGTITVTMESAVATTNELEIYLFFTTADGSKSSNSEHVQETV